MKLRTQHPSFGREVARIAVPTSLQTLLQISILSFTDEVMIGRLGSVSVAAVGLANKFVSGYSLLLASVSMVAGIMVAQALGGGERESVSRSFSVNMAAALGLSLLFCAVSMLFPLQIAGLYTPDAATRQEAAAYLHILGWNYIPVAITALLTTLFRCLDKARIALGVSILSTKLNILLDYLFIFGTPLFAPLGTAGAAVATVASQSIGCLMAAVFFFRYRRLDALRISPDLHIGWSGTKRFLAMLLPVLFSFLSFTVVDNLYTVLYGNMGTQSYAAVALLAPLQMLTVSLLTGVGSSAGILVAKSIGAKHYEEAYRHALRLVLYGLVLSAVIGGLLILLRAPYTALFNVEATVRKTTQRLIVLWALFTPVRMLNMIVGGNIVRAGGNTKTMMWVDIVSNWCVGVPLALTAVLLLHLSVEGVSLMIAGEEVLRLAVSLVLLRGKKWMEEEKLS